MMRKKGSLKLKLKERALILVNSTSIHGIGKIVNSLNKISKILWFTFVMLSWVYCSYVITISVISFLEYKTITNIDVIYEQRPEFPRITVCGHNPGTWKCRFNDLVCPDNSTRETDFFYGQNCTTFNSGQKISFIFLPFFNFKRFQSQVINIMVKK